MSLLKYEAFMAFKNATKESDYQTAISAITRHLKETPNDAVALSNLGVFQKAANKHRDALGSLTKSLGVDDTRALTYFNRADVYSDLGMLDEALQDYATCLELNPGFEEARVAKEGIECLQSRSRQNAEPELTRKFG